MSAQVAREALPAGGFVHREDQFSRQERVLATRPFRSNGIIPDGTCNCVHRLVDALPASAQRPRRQGDTPRADVGDAPSSVVFADLEFFIVGGPSGEGWRHRDVAQLGINRDDEDGYLVLAVSHRGASCGNSRSLGVLPRGSVSLELLFELGCLPSWKIRAVEAPRAGPHP